MSFHWILFCFVSGCEALGFRIFPHNININNIFWAVCSVIRTLLTQSFFYSECSLCCAGWGGLAFDPGRSLVEQFPSERPLQNSFDRSVSSDTSDSEVSPSAGLPEAAGSPLRSLVTLIGGSVSRKWRPEAPLIWSGLRRFSLSERSVQWTDKSSWTQEVKVVHETGTLMETRKVIVSEKKNQSAALRTNQEVQFKGCSVITRPNDGVRHVFLQWRHVFVSFENSYRWLISDIHKVVLCVLMTFINVEKHFRSNDDIFESLLKSKNRNIVSTMTIERNISKWSTSCFWQSLRRIFCHDGFLCPGSKYRHPHLHHVRIHLLLLTSLTLKSQMSEPPWMQHPEDSNGSHLYLFTAVRRGSLTAGKSRCQCWIDLKLM